MTVSFHAVILRVMSIYPSTCEALVMMKTENCVLCVSLHQVDQIIFTVVKVFTYWYQFLIFSAHQVHRRMKQLQSHTNYMTEHPGLETVCLTVYSAKCTHLWGLTMGL